MLWPVYVHPEAELELSKIVIRERTALVHAIEKLEQIGPILGEPHAKHIQMTDEPLRELRPRQGRCPYRAFFRDFDSASVVAAIGPEADQDRRGFHRAVAAALDRLATVEEDQENTGSST